MTYYPKLLQPVEITSTNNTFGYTHGGAHTVNIPVGTYDTMIEVLAALQVVLDVEEPAMWVNGVVVSYRGIVSIAGNDAWTVNWATTDNGLETLLGFTGAEAVDGGTDTLTATKRHLYGWYAPVGVEYPGIRRRLPRRVQETDAGGASIISSAQVHEYIDLLFDACLEGHLDPIAAAAAGAIDDGYGSTLDWDGRDFETFWVDVAAKTFRYYEDASNGTVADPGAEGVEYLTCVRLDQELAFEQVDSGGYTYFSVRLPVKVVGS